MLIAGCKGDEPSGQPPNADQEYEKLNSEYILLKAEIELLSESEPYLVLDFRHNKIALKLKAATVWDYPFNFEKTDSQDIGEFLNAFRNDKSSPVKPVKSKHLFESVGQTPDSVLKIVGEAVNVKPELLQRDIPEQFQIAWSNDLKLVVKTEVRGKALSSVRNAIIHIADALESPLGGNRIELKMDPTAALTLYRAVEKGMPTLVVD